MRAADRVWIRVRIPGRPNGRKGWVPRDALGHLHAVTTALRIEKGRSRATLRRKGRIVWRSPIGHGAPGMATPSGRFYIRERLDNRGGDPVYGPLAFGTSAYSALSEWPGGGVIGIHGTEPAVADPRSPVARLHPRSESGDPAARRAHADRDADQDPLSEGSPACAGSASALP